MSAQINLQEAKKLLSESAARLSDSQFWRAVDDAGWTKNRFDYKKIKARLLRSWKPAFGIAFRETMSDKVGDLYDALSGRVQGASDDGFDDLLHHIVGMGKKAYIAAMRDPAFAQDLVDKSRYRESFSYAIPYDDEWEQVGNPSKFFGWADDVLKKLRSFGHDPSLEGDVDVLWDAMQLLLKSDVKKFLKLKKTAKKSADNLDRATRGGFNKWLVWNLYSDVEEFLA